MTTPQTRFLSRLTVEDRTTAKERMIATIAADWSNQSLSLLVIAGAHSLGCTLASLRDSERAELLAIAEDLTNGR